MSAPCTSTGQRKRAAGALAVLCVFAAAEYKGKGELYSVDIGGGGG